MSAEPKARLVISLPTADTGVQLATRGCHDNFKRRDNVEDLYLTNETGCFN